jgi:hypothetical protein
MANHIRTFIKVSLHSPGKFTGILPHFVAAGKRAGLNLFLHSKRSQQIPDRSEALQAEATKVMILVCTSCKTITLCDVKPFFQTIAPIKAD